MDSFSTLEPIECGRYHLSKVERERRRTKELCMYCVISLHSIANCNKIPRDQDRKTREPAKPPKVPSQMVSRPFISYHQPLAVEVLIVHSCSTSSLLALIDSGANGNFMDLRMAQRLKIPLLELQHPPPYTSMERSLINPNH